MSATNPKFRQTNNSNKGRREEVGHGKARILTFCILFKQSKTTYLDLNQRQTVNNEWWGKFACQTPIGWLFACLTGMELWPLNAPNMFTSLLIIEVTCFVASIYMTLRGCEPARWNVRHVDVRPQSAFPPVSSWLDRYELEWGNNAVCLHSFARLLTNAGVIARHLGDWLCNWKCLTDRVVHSPPPGAMSPTQWRIVAKWWSNSLRKLMSNALYRTRIIIAAEFDF